MATTFLSICDNPSRYERQIENQNFIKEDVLERYLDSCFFDETNFSDCSFNDCEFIGLDFGFCSFTNCSFNNVIIRKSAFFCDKSNKK